MSDVLQSLREGFAFFLAILPLGVFTLLPLWLLLSRGRFDRHRITDSIEGRGWEVLGVDYAPRFFDSFSRRSGRRYRVVYRTGTGEIVAAECLTSLFAGTEWISNVPFSLSGGGWGPVRSNTGCEPWEVDRRDRIRKIRAMLP